MTIKNVNGRNVYVITPKPADENKFDWGAQYTQMRWKIWENEQQNEARMLQVEMQGADTQRAFYDDKIEAIRKDISATKKAGMKAEGGYKGEAQKLRMRSAAELRRLSGKEPTVTFSDQMMVDKYGVPVYAEKDLDKDFNPLPGAVPRRKQKTTTKTGGGAKQSQELIDYHTGIISATDDQLLGAGKVRDFDSELEELDAQLSQAIEGRSNVALPDYDLNARTRRAFSASQGTMEAGSGGTIFGMAPRKRRTHHYVDQGLMKPRVREFAERVEAERDETRQSIQALDSRIAEFQAIGGEPGGQTDTLLQMAIEQRAALTDKLANPEALQQAMGSEDFRTREAGELFRRDSGASVLAGDEAAVGGGDGFEVEDAATPAPAPAIDPVVADIMGYTDEGYDRLGDDPAYMPPDMGTKPEGALPEFDDQAGVINTGDEGRVGPADLSGPPRMPPGLPPMKLSQDDALRNPAMLSYDDYVADDNLLAAAREWAKNRDADTGQPRFPKLAARRAEAGKPVRRGTNKRIKYGSQEELIQAYLKDVKYQQDNASASTQTRKDRYKTQVITAGVKLAAAPKKFDRIAKTNADVGDRPAHVNIVDKLYRVNNGREDAFKSAYDEINRAYASDPDTRKQAHTYLVALDIMSDNISDPMA